MNMPINAIKKRLLDIIEASVAKLLPACLDAVRDLCPTMPKDYKISVSAPSVDLGRRFALVVLRIEDVGADGIVRVDVEHFDTDLTKLVHAVCQAYATPFMVTPARAAKMIRDGA